MIYLATILLGCLAAVIVLAWLAPEGWEDARGFHRGRQPSGDTRADNPERLGAPSPVVAHSFHAASNSREA